ncbi:MAG: translation initiation factor IF-6 [Methanobacteriota archaeon]|nr:MAG: translation initiation factor IF-6 [Euryarchaeota archaeon]
MISKASFFGNPFIGLFSSVNDNYALVPLEDDGRFAKLIEETLSVEVVKTNIADTPLAGIYVAMSNKGVVLPNLIQDKELALLKEAFEITYVSKPPFNAWGNNLVITSKGAIINPELREEAKEIEDVFSVEVLPMSVGGYKVVGSAVYATEKGFVATHRASDEEMEAIEDILKVKGNRATVNMGSPVVSIGLLANSQGLLIGEMSTGIEIARVQEGLDLL